MPQVQHDLFQPQPATTSTTITRMLWDAFVLITRADKRGNLAGNNYVHRNDYPSHGKRVATQKIDAAVRPYVDPIFRRRSDIDRGRGTWYAGIGLLVFVSESDGDGRSVYVFHERDAQQFTWRSISHDSDLALWTSWVEGGKTRALARGVLQTLIGGQFDTYPNGYMEMCARPHHFGGILHAEPRSLRGKAIEAAEQIMQVGEAALPDPEPIVWVDPNTPCYLDLSRSE